MDEVELYEVTSYESAGVWIESADTPCLVVWARFDDGTEHMRLLYEGELRRTADEVTEEGQWIILDVGTGDHLQDLGDGKGIKADGKAQGPILTEVRIATCPCGPLF